MAAETNQEVKATLSVQTEGDAQAFQTAASGVLSLAESASGASPSLSSITEALGRLASSAKAIGPAGEAFQRFASAVERFAGAKDLDEQRKALAEVLSTWKEFGASVPEILDKSSQAAKEYKESLEQIEAVQKRLADPLVQSAEKANEALGDLKEGLEESFSGAENKVVNTRHAIDQYRASLEAARASGANVTGEQEAELQRLENEYKAATKAVGEYQRAKNQAKKDIEAATKANELEGKSINDLGDIAEVASPKLGKLLAVGASIVGAFTAGYAAGEKLRGILNSLSDGAFDRFIQQGLRMQAVADRIADGLGRIGRESNILANQKNIFDRLGIEGFSRDVEENSRIIERHARAISADRATVEEFARTLGLSRQQLDEQGEALARSVELFRQANPQIDPKVFRSLIDGPIQDLLDAYSRLGVEVPRHLQALADAWGITTSKAEESTKRHAAAIKALTEQITGVVSRSIDELREQAAVVAETVSAINKASLSPEGLARAREQVQVLIEQFRAAKVEIPTALVAAADKVGVFVAAMERAGGVIPVYSAHSEAAVDSTVRLGTAADGTRASITGLGESTLRAAGDLDAGTAAITSINPVAGEAQISLKALMDRYGEAGHVAREAGGAVSAASAGIAKGAAALGDAADQVAANGDALEWAKDNAQAAVEPLGQAGDAANRLGDGSARASKALDGLNRDAATSSQAVDGLRVAVSQLQASLAALSAVQFGGAIIAQLDAIHAKALATQAALDALSGAGRS